jgi:hypothetical protein
VEHISRFVVGRRQEAPDAISQSGSQWIIDKTVSLGLQAAPIENEAFWEVEEVGVKKRQRPHIVEGVTFDLHGTG